MTDIINMHGVKKVFTIGVVAATILWSIGIAAVVPLQAEAAASGDLIKASLASVYFVGADLKRYVFPNERTYKSWYSDFSTVKKITDAELAAIPIGGNATYKPGVKLVKITTDPKVYAVAAGGALRHLASEAVAAALYGASWAGLVHDVPDAFFTNYTTGAQITAAADFNVSAVTAAATSINVDKGLATGTQPGPTTPAGQEQATALTIERKGLSANGNVTGVSVRDSSGKQHGNTGTSWGDDNKMTIDFASDPISLPAEVTVEANLNTGALTGNVVFALTSVTANSSVSATLAATNPAATTLASGTAFNPVLRVALAKAATASGLPLSSNTHSLADGSNSIGTVTIDAVQVHNNGTSDATPVNVNLGTTLQEVARFRLATGANEIVALKSLKLYNNGSAADGDFTNIQLVAPDGKKFTADKSTGKFVSFDLAGYELAKSSSAKDFKIYADLINGSTRTLRLLVQNDYDLVVTGKASGASILPTLVGGGTPSGNDQAFPVGDRNGANYINMLTISAGTLTFSKASNSPTGNVAQGASGIVLGSWEAKGNGEAFEIRQIEYLITRSAATNFSGTLYFKVYDDAGNVVGTLYSAAGSGLTYGAATTVTSTFVTLQAGKTYYVKAIGDILSTAAEATTYSIRLDIPSAKRISTGDVVDPSVTASTANTLTVRAGSLTVTSNAGATAPSVVSGQNSLVTIGTADMTAGSGEGIEISSIVIGDSTAGLGRNFKELEIWLDGAKRSQDTSATQAPGATTTTVTFNLNPALTIDASQTKTIEIKAKIVTSPSDVGSTLTMQVDASGVTATGLTSRTALSSVPAAIVNLQTVTLNSAGTLVVSRDTVTNVKQSQLVAGTTGVVFGAYKFQTGNIEDVKIKKITIRNIGSNTNGIVSFGIYDGATLLPDDPATTANEGIVKASLGGDASVLGNDPKSATFDFSARPYTIAKNSFKVLTIKANTVYAATSGETAQLAIDSIDAEGAGSAVAIRPTLTTELTDSSAARAYALGEVAAISNGTAATMYISPVTTAVAAAADITAGNAVFQGVTLSTTHQVTMLRPVSNGSTLQSENASSAATYSYAIGDFVAVNDSDAAANSTVHPVTTAVAVGATLVGAGVPFTGLTLNNSGTDRLTRLPSGFSETTLATAETVYNVGDILAFGDADAVANNGLYVVTNAIAVGGDMTAGGTVASQAIQAQSGAAIVTGDRVAKMPTLHTEAPSATATYAYSVGDVVVIDDDGTPANNGAYVVKTAVAAGASLLATDALGTGITLVAADRISKLALTSGGAQEDSLKRLYPTKIAFTWTAPASASLSTGGQIEVARFTLGAEAANANNPGATVSVTALNFTNLSTARFTNITLHDVTNNVNVATNANSTSLSSSAAGGALSTLTFQQGEQRTFRFLADVGTSAGAQTAQLRFNAGTHITAGTATWSVTNNAVTSNSTWSPIAGDAADTSSTSLASASTGSDTAAPTITSITIAGDTTGNDAISANTTFAILFSEKIDPVTIASGLTYGATTLAITEANTADMTLTHASNSCGAGGSNDFLNIVNIACIDTGATTTVTSNKTATTEVDLNAAGTQLTVRLLTISAGFEGNDGTEADGGEVLTTVRDAAGNLLGASTWTVTSVDF